MGGAFFQQGNVTPSAEAKAAVRNRTAVTRKRKIRFILSFLLHKSSCMSVDQTAEKNIVDETRAR